MGTNIKAGAAASMTLLLLSGCAPVAQNYGEAVAFNKYAQTVDPSPDYPEDGAKPGDSGEHAADAVKAYREGNVKQPSRGRSGSSGGSGGGISVGPR